MAYHHLSIRVTSVRIPIGIGSIVVRHVVDVVVAIDGHERSHRESAHQRVVILAAYTDAGLVAVNEADLLAHFQQVLEQLVLGVHAEVVAGEVGHVLTAYDTFLRHVAQRNGIGGSGRTARHTEGVTLQLGVVLEHGAHPVGVIQVAVGIADRLVAVPIVMKPGRIVVRLVHNHHVLLGVQHVCRLRYVLHAKVAVERNHSLAFLALLGGHQYYAVGSLRTVDSGRSGILQDIDALDIGGVQVGNISTHAIDKVQRFCITYGTQTTDAHLEAFTRLTGSGGDVYTRRLSLHGLQGVGGVQFGNLVTFHLNGSTRHQFFLLYAVTYNHDFVQHLIVFLQHHVDGRSAAHLDGLRYKANVRED